MTIPAYRLVEKLLHLNNYSKIAEILSFITHRNIPVTSVRIILFSEGLINPDKITGKIHTTLNELETGLEEIPEGWERESRRNGIKLMTFFMDYIFHVGEGHSLPTSLEAVEGISDPGPFLYTFNRMLPLVLVDEEQRIRVLGQLAKAAGGLFYPDGVSPGEVQSSIDLKSQQESSKLQERQIQYAHDLFQQRLRLEDFKDVQQVWDTAWNDAIKDIT